MKSPLVRFCQVCVFTYGTMICAQQPSMPVLPQAYVNTDLSVTQVTGRSIPVHAGDDLQAAINGANSGDELVLDAGATWAGSYVFPAKSGSGWLTVRTSALDKLPPSGSRVNPGMAPLMPRLLAPNGLPAIVLAPQAHNIRFIGLEVTVPPGTEVSYTLVASGDSTDPDPNNLPRNIIFDRLFVHGQILCHCKTGIQMNIANVAVVDSYLSDFHGLGQDTQSLTSYMSPGPQKIVNNYLEAAGENVMWGGAWTAIPDLHAADVEFRNNLVAKPLTWMKSIVPAPQRLTVTAGDGGSLAAGNYYYQVVAAGTVGTLSDKGSAQSDPSSEVAVALPAGKHKAILTWMESAYGDSADTRTADNYLVLRTSDPPTAAVRNWVYYTYTPSDPRAATFSSEDTGNSVQAWPGGWPRIWMVKNLFELKNGKRFLVTGNVFDGNWVNGQNGHAIVLTPRDDDPPSPSQPQLIAEVRDVTFKTNVVRNVAAGINILAEDYLEPAAYYAISGQHNTAGVYIGYNLFDNDNGQLFGGGPGDFLSFSAGLMDQPGVNDLIADHNTVLHTGNIGCTAFTDLVSSHGAFQFTNNIVANNDYGLCIDGHNSSWATMQQLFASLVWTHNVVPLAVGTPWGRYTDAAGDLFPPSYDAVGFVNFNGGAGGDYHLAADSPYKHAALDGTDPGADIDALDKVIGTVVAGIDSSSGVVSSVAITIQSNTVGAPFLVDGTNTYQAPMTFSWVPGSQHTIQWLPGSQVGTRYVFDSWSDGGVNSRVISTPFLATTFTANLRKQYLVSTAVVPADSGKITSNSPSPDGYYDSGSTITLTVTAASGYLLSYLQGIATTNANQPSITVNGPISITANFSLCQYAWVGIAVPGAAWPSCR